MSHFLNKNLIEYFGNEPYHYATKRLNKNYGVLNLIVIMYFMTIRQNAVAKICPVTNNRSLIVALFGPPHLPTVVFMGHSLLGISAFLAVVGLTLFQ